MLPEYKPHDPNKTYTRGGICIEDMKIGDIHYDYEYGTYVKCEVIELPTRLEEDLEIRGKTYPQFK